jgi:hypothetical protein
MAFCSTPILKGTVFLFIGKVPGGFRLGSRWYPLTEEDTVPLPDCPPAKTAVLKIVKPRISMTAFVPKPLLIIFSFRINYPTDGKTYRGRLYFIRQTLVE